MDFALLLNATGWVYCWCRAMRLPERRSGASIGLGPLVDGDMRLPPADVAASAGEQNAHSGRRIQASRKQPHRTTTQSPDRQVKLAIAPTSGSKTSKTGEPNFCRNFWTTFLGVPRKNFIYLPKFLMPFFSHWPFSFFMWYFSVGGQIRGRHRYGGPKSLLFDKITMLPLLFLPPEGGQTPLPTSCKCYGLRTNCDRA